MGVRRELARRRKALGYSQERLAEVLGVDRVTIGRWERGETDPQPYLRPRLAKALQSSAAEIEALLSPQGDRPAPVPARAVSAEAPGAHAESGYRDDMIRREFLRLVSLTGALVALSPDDADRVPAEDVAEVQVMTSHLWQVYGLARAKQTVYPLVHDQISDLTRLLGHAHREGRHRELCGQAGSLFQLAGEIFFDGNRYTEAAECYALAASASKEAGNADLWAASLTRHSFIGVYERRFRETAPILDAAGLLARKGDSHLSTRYWVAAVQAQVYAGLGDLDACNRALDQAQEVHYLSDPSPGGWLRFDGSRLDEERGKLLRDAGAPGPCRDSTDRRLGAPTLDAPTGKRPDRPGRHRCTAPRHRPSAVVRNGCRGTGRAHIIGVHRKKTGGAPRVPRPFPARQASRRLQRPYLVADRRISAPKGSNMTDQGRIFREAWIKGVHSHFPGEPKPGYVAPWEETPDWERDAATAVYGQVAEFLTVSGGRAARLTREQKGRFVSLCWIAQIHKHFPDPKPAYVADWNDQPKWQQETNSDIFEAIEKQN